MTNEGIKYLAGAIILVEVPKRKVGKGPFFTGRGMAIPSNDAKHVLTYFDEWDHARGSIDALGVGKTYSESFSGYLPSSHPSTLHPSFKHKTLKQILNFYIDNKNDVVNEETEIKSRVLKVGYAFQSYAKNKERPYLFTDPEYCSDQVYLTLEEYVNLDQPKQVVKKESVEAVKT
ncbi:hypothetical protein GOV14_03090 [Candidatus Pacearchaeota archaeon]|nr:hypothetical protein [Candidatus Pacearchaeota archaeon]